MSSATNPRIDIDDTRGALLQSAAREIHYYGFRSASLSRILAETGVTKGALYHHFSSKRALGYAVLDECYAPIMRETWIEPLRRLDTDAVSILIAIIEKAGSEISPQDLERGCPINNLAQEMSPVDAGFRTRIEALLAEWRAAIATALRRSQADGEVASHVQPDAAATFIVASLEGCIGMAKNAQSHEMLLQCGAGLIDYLRTLHVVPDGEAH